MNSNPLTAPMIVLPKNSREELRVSLDTFKGHSLINLRIWYLSRDGDMRPTKKGIAMRTDTLPEVIAALIELHSHTNEDGKQCY